MARTCTICSNPQLQEIDQALVAGGSIRDIAGRFGISRSALDRHKRDHLARFLAESTTVSVAPVVPPQPPPKRDANRDAGRESAALQLAEREAIREVRALDLFAILSQTISRVLTLLDATDEFLRDPEDPSRYTLDARAHEMDVIWEDRTTIDEGGKPVRRRSSLQELIDLVHDTGRGVLVSVRTKQADPRELHVKAAAELRAELVPILEKLAGVERLAEFQEAVLQAIAEASPETKERIEQALRKRAALAGIGR